MSIIKKIYYYFGGPAIKLQFKEYLKSYFLFKSQRLEKKQFEIHYYDFKKKNRKYQKIELNLNHKKFLTEINPRKHLKIVKKLKISKNPHYFLNLQSYGIRGVIFDKTYGNSIKKKYFLSPSCIVFLEIISKVNFKNDNFLVVDFGSGLGNFLGYLNTFIPRKNLIGIDDFSQVSQENILKYQKQTFRFNILPYSELTKDLEHFIWILGGFGISNIIEEINEIKPLYIFAETTYLTEIDLIRDFYEIDFFNEIVVILKKKNESTIQEFFKNSSKI